MADETEVVYSYVGDVSSLREATKEAISLLDRYDSTLKRMASSPDFGASKTATTNFQRSISGMIKQVNSLTKSINTAGASVDKSIPDGTALMSGVTRDLADVLSFLDSSTKITSDDLKILTQVMKEARESIDSVTARAQLLSNSMKPLEQMSVAQSMDKASASAEKAEKHYARAAQAGFRIQEAYQLANKSAAESAAVFIRAGQSAERLTGVQSVVQSIRTEMQLLGTQAAMAWQKFASYIDPTGDKIRSLQSKTSTALGKMKSVIAKVSSAFRRNTTEADDNSNSYGNLNNRAKSLLSTLSSIGSRARSTSGHFDVLTSSVKLLNRALYTLIGVNVGRWLAGSIKQSISYVENLNLFQVATGEAYEESLKFIDSMSELYGMDPSNLMRYAGNFYQLADAISMPDKASAALSLGLTKATNDIASLFNVDIETVFQNLSSGMQGMSRAVRKYGMDIRTTTLQQTALSLGLTEQVENMSEANRQGLRFITMMQQANNASGDFARTIESPANQLRIFKEQVTQLGRAIGNFLIEPLATAIQYINGFVMALRMVLQFIGSLFGVLNAFGGRDDGAGGVEKTLDNVASGVGSVGSAAKESTKELKKMLAPFDELTLLQKPETDLGTSGGGGGVLSDVGTLDPTILKAIEEMQWKLDEVEMKAVNVRNAILEFLGFKVEDGTILSWDASALEENLINKFPQWTKTIEAVFNNWSDIVLGFQHVWEAAVRVIQKSWDKFTSYLSTVVNDDSLSEFINEISTSLENMAGWIDSNIDMLSNLVLAIGAMTIVRSIMPLIDGFGQVLLNVFNFGRRLVGVFTGLSVSTILWSGLIALVAYTLVDLWNTSEEFRDKVTDAWNNVVSVFTTTWDTLLKPMFDTLVTTISNIYEGCIKPVVESIATVILDLWNDILAPLITWFVETFGPAVSSCFDTILTAVENILQPISTTIQGIMQVLTGLIEFISGTFSGNWEKAWQGIVDVFTGLFNGIAGVVVTILNAVIGTINTVVAGLYNSVVSLVNSVLGAVNDLGAFFGADWNLNIGSPPPAIPYIEMPALATGGVVTSPTHALIGEGRYDEAVVPLGNSPQMKQFADSVANKVNSGEQIELLKDQNDLLRQILARTGTYIDGREITNVVSRYQRMDARSLGG